LRILDRFEGAVLGDLPAASLHDAAPNYDRPLAEPVGRASRLSDDPGEPSTQECGAAVLDQLCDTSWVSRQYDHQLFLNTVEAPGGDAAVLRLKHPTTGEDTGRGLALTADGNHRWCALDPRRGTAHVVAEAVANLACVGARPIGVVNCLNFGNPEHPEVMWQLSEAIDGMGDACRAFGLPVVGGNVSLYNESNGENIDPTPVIAMVGLVDHLDRRPPGPHLADGHRLVLLGDDGKGASRSLAGSAWAWAAGRTGGTLADLDLPAFTRLAGLVRSLVADGLLTGVHDVASGGLGVALAEMAVRSGVGFDVTKLADPADLLAETPGRIVVCVSKDALPTVHQRHLDTGVPARFLGTAGGDRLVATSAAGIALLDVSLEDATRTWRDRLPVALGGAVAQ
jgi:phosphoribosylformylglycinamidine synthase